MKNLLLPLILAGAALAADNEVEGLLFGFSHHFQNRDQYQYREANPGVGLSYWRTVADTIAIGASAASFRNSYDMNSMALMASVKYEKHAGDLSYGMIGGFGSLSGYDTDKLCPHLSGFVGAWSMKLHMAYMPYREGCDSRSRPSSSALAVWLGVTLARW